MRFTGNVFKTLFWTNFSRFISFQIYLPNQSLLAIVEGTQLERAQKDEDIAAFYWVLSSGRLFFQDLFQNKLR